MPFRCCSLGMLLGHCLLCRSFAWKIGTRNLEWKETARAISTVKISETYTFQLQQIFSWGIFLDLCESRGYNCWILEIKSPKLQINFTLQLDRTNQIHFQHWVFLEYPTLGTNIHISISPPTKHLKARHFLRVDDHFPTSPVWLVGPIWFLVSPGSQGIPIMSPNQRPSVGWRTMVSPRTFGVWVYASTSWRQVGRVHGGVMVFFLTFFWVAWVGRCFCVFVFLLFSFLTLFLSGDVWLASAIETDKKTRYWCDMFNDLGLFYGVLFPSLLLGPEDQRPWQQLMVTTTNHSYTIS